MKSKVAQTCSVGLRLSLYLAGRIGRIPACRAWSLVPSDRYSFVTRNSRRSRRASCLPFCF
jgi:hypothetical protein